MLEFVHSCSSPLTVSSIVVVLNSYIVPNIGQHGFNAHIRLDINTAPWRSMVGQLHSVWFLASVTLHIYCVQSPSITKSLASWIFWLLRYSFYPCSCQEGCLMRVDIFIANYSNRWSGVKLAAYSLHRITILLVSLKDESPQRNSFFGWFSYSLFMNACSYFLSKGLVKFSFLQSSERSVLFSQQKTWISI